MERCDPSEKELVPEKQIAGDGGQINLKCSPSGCLRILAASFGYNRNIINREHLNIAQNFCDGRAKCSLKATKKMFNNTDKKGITHSIVKFQYKYHSDGDEFDTLSLTVWYSCFGGEDESFVQVKR